MMKEKTEIHRTTIYIPVAVWNAIRLHAIKTSQRLNTAMVQALRERFGEVDNLSKIRVNDDGIQ